MDKNGNHKFKQIAEGNADCLVVQVMVIWGNNRKRIINSSRGLSFRRKAVILELGL